MTNNNVISVVLSYIATISYFRLFDGSDDFPRYDGFNYISDSTPGEVRRKLHEALNSLSLHDQQSVLVQFWAPTKAGKVFLLTTTYQLYGVYGLDPGLDVYRKGCLQHKLFVDRDGNESVGLPGLAFKEETRQQTRNMNFYYPEDIRPKFESNAIFPMKWGSFAVPVFLKNTCVGVLEFITTKSMSSYDGDMDLVEEALKCAGLQSSKENKSSKEISIPKTKRTDAPTETTSSNKKRRKTQKRMYASYNCVASYFGLSKEEAMKRVKRKFNLTKDVKETTFTEVLRKLGITNWPYVKNGREASTSYPKTQDNPTASKIPTGLEPAENAPLIHNTNERQFVRDSDATENQHNNVSWLNYIENQLMADLDENQANETLAMANFFEPPMNPTSSELPAGLEPAENAHLIHDTNKRQLGIYSGATENQYNDAPLMAPVVYTEDQAHLVTAPVDETSAMAISYETPSPTLDELVRAIMRSPGRFFMPEVIGRIHQGEENPLMTIHTQTTTMMS